MTAVRGPRVMRAWEWSFPPRGEHLEVLSALPDEQIGRPPLLFLPGLGHGAWCYAEHWLPAAAERGYPAYSMSFRGHGGSGGHTRLGRTTGRDYLHDLLQVVASLPAPPVLIAHSLAALPARQALARYPAPAGVLLAPIPAAGLRRSLLAGAVARPRATIRTLLGGTCPFTATDLFADLEPELAATYVSRLGRESPWVQYSMATPSRLEPMRAPVLVVGADDDRLLARTDLERAADELATTVAAVPGGHDMMLDGAWATALATVLDWVDATCPAGQPALSGAAVLEPLSQSLGSGD